MTRIVLIVLVASACSPRTAVSPQSGSDAGASGSDAAVTADAPPGAFVCAPVKHYSFTSTAIVPLGCDGNAPVPILSEPIPATGRAIARATFSVQHTGGNSVTHFWNVSIQVGAAKDEYGLGDDVCPGTTSARGNLGFGTLTAAADAVNVVGFSGASPCTPGTLQVLAGAVLDVWVEDPTAGCVGGDLAFGSYYDANGVTQQYDWTTSFTPLPGAAATLTTTGASERLRVLGVVEGSPGLDPNTTCGTEAATVDLETDLDSATMAQDREVVPASQGLGHRVMFTSGDVNELRDVTPGAHTATLQVATDFINGHFVTTGGCCGDGEVALIRLR